MKQIVLQGITNASETVTLTATGVTGYLEKVEYDYVDGAIGAVGIFIINDVTTVAGITGLGTADAVYYFRVAPDNNVGADYSEQADKFYLHNDKFSIVIASGARTKTFKFILHLSDGDKNDD